MKDEQKNIYYISGDDKEVRGPRVITKKLLLYLGYISGDDEEVRGPRVITKKASIISRLYLC